MVGQQIKTDQLPHPRPGAETICDLTCHKYRNSADANLGKKIKNLSVLVDSLKRQLKEVEVSTKTEDCLSDLKKTIKKVEGLNICQNKATIVIFQKEEDFRGHRVVHNLLT